MSANLLKLALACCAWPMAAVAGTPPDLPPAAKAPTTLDFFRRPQNHGALLSPDGKNLAVLVEAGNTTKLGIIDLSNRKITAAFSVGDDEIIYSFLWASNTRVVFNTTVKEGPLDKPVLTGHVYAGNIDQSEVLELNTTGELEFIAGAMESDPQHIFISHGQDIYTQNIYSGWMKFFASLPRYADVFFTDHHDKLRFAAGEDKDDFVTAVRDDANSSWKEINRERKTGGVVEPVAFSADDRHVFLRSNVEASTEGFFDLDLTSGDKRLLFRDEHVDLGPAIYGPGVVEPVGVIYSPDYPTYKFFDNGTGARQIYSALQSAYPDEFVRVINFSKDGHLAVVFAGSDTDPGRYALLDVAERKLVPLFEERPWLDPAKMSMMNAVTVKARDGLELRGYLTLPRQAASPHNLPLVVLVHGGPHGIRDEWGFDPQVQFLAYHGYAVLQINYRGSGGYGREFEKLGYRHWGTTMQDDVTDSTRWAIAQGIADPRRICIFGASYGGYAALMGVIREPDLYRCAIGYDGAYDLGLQLNRSDTSRSDSGMAYLKEVVGEDSKDLQARSPVFNVERIKVPVFLAHGGKDRRTPFKGYEELIAEFDKHKISYETLVKEQEGHGFYTEANNVELYDALLKFLDRNTAAPAAQPSP